VSRLRARLRGRAGLAVLIALAAAQALVWVRGVPDGAPVTTAFAWRALLLFALQAAAVAVAWRRRDRAAVIVVVVAAVGFRLAALSWPAGLSSDLYRYLWDGRVQVAGHSPYAAPPAAAELAPLRDDRIWPRINRPEAVTVYPPGAEVAFLALARAGGDSVTAVRAAALGAELIALALLVLLLRRRRLGAGHLIVYAWSPLIIAEVCVSGHVDALVLPLAIGALLAGERRPGWAGVLIGAGVLLKLYPILLLAALPRRSQPRAAVAAVVTVIAGYLPYALAAGSGVLGFLPDYARSGEDFNPALRGFAEQGLGLITTHARALAMAAAAAGLAVLWITIGVRGGGDRFTAARRIALGFILLLPTAVHPWYALWLVPLLAVDFSAGGLWIAGMLPLSYLKYAAAGEQMPGWVPLVEWLPALALLALAWRGDLRVGAAEAA